MVRLPPITPDRLDDEQRALYERSLRQIETEFQGFTARRRDGALLGPWGVFLHEPAVGQAHYDQIDAITQLKRLPESAKQIAILVVGSRFGAAYEMYAHAAVAIEGGMDRATVATIAAGERPTGLDEKDAAAFDVAAALAGGGVLPGATYRRALDQFGQGALTELVLWVAIYAQVSIILNAFDVPSEEEF